MSSALPTAFYLVATVCWPDAMSKQVRAAAQNCAQDNGHDRLVRELVSPFGSQAFGRRAQGNRSKRRALILSTGTVCSRSGFFALGRRQTLDLTTPVGVNISPAGELLDNGSRC